MDNIFIMKLEANFGALESLMDQIICCKKILAEGGLKAWEKKEFLVALKNIRDERECLVKSIIESESEIVDLFEYPILQNDILVDVCSGYFAKLSDLASYEVCESFLESVEKIGYTFEYYLDAEPYNLTKKKEV